MIDAVNTDFYDHPDLYDALLPAGGEAAFYADLAREQGGPVLELACGTGQLTVPIAAQGLPTVGLDSSAAMLQAAQRRASAAGVPVTFLAGDMRNFSLDRQFALVFIARNSLLHLHAADDLIATFAAAKRHLAPGGLVAFDIFNPSIRLLARADGQRAPVMQVETAQFGRVDVEQTYIYDSATQVGHATWFISTPEQRDAWVVPLNLRSIFPQELPLLLQAAGLELVSRFGEHTREPFRSDSRIQLCLCRRRE